MIKKSFFISIFPKIFNEILGVGIAKKALDNGIIDYEVVNPMNFLDHKERLDDTTYGGGPGMLLKAQPLIESIDFCKSKANKKTKVIYLSPQGQVFNQSISRELAKEDKLIFLCGSYEGIDHRVIDSRVDLEISLGDYVLSGGEIAALALHDSICRNYEGFLGDENSLSEESFEKNLLEYPQFTKPRESKFGNVPDVLLSGDHKKISDWRRKQSLGKTFINRRDLFSKLELSDQDIKILKEFLSEVGYDSDRISDLLEEI